MRQPIRCVWGLLVLAGCWACATPANVAGDWSGRVAPAHFDFLELRITQDGSVIRGAACYEVVPGSATGGVVFKDAVVNGMYPTITVRAPNYNGWTFTGEFQDGGTLLG